MPSISAIIVVVFWAAITLASTDKKGDVKMVDLAEELAQSRQDLAKAREETKEENGKLRQELTKLRHELHQANTDMKTTMRQKDQNNTQELKQLMKDQIEEYLKENKLCVAGKFAKNPRFLIDEWMDVDFNYTFPRVPTFTASLNAVGLRPPLDSTYNDLVVDDISTPANVTRSSAKCRIHSDDRWHFFELSWIACL